MRFRAALAAAALAAALLAGCQPGRPAAIGTPDGDQLCVGWLRKGAQVTCYVPLTAEQASHRRHAKLTFRGGKAVRLVYLNGAGGVATDDTEDAGFDVTYEADRETKRWFDRWGRTTTLSVYLSRGRWERRTAWGTPKRDRKTDPYVHVQTDDANGFVASDKLVDESGRPAAKDGVCESRYVHDAAGHVLETRHFDVDGRAVVNASGFHRVVDRVNALGCVEERTSYDVEGRLAGGMQGVPRGLRTCDSWGSVVAMRFVDERGAPLINAQGIHGWNDVLDTHGALSMRTTVGVDGKPAPVNGQESIRREKVDARGYAVEVSYFDRNGAPFVLSSHNSGVRFVRAPNGAALAAQYVDANGALVKVETGYAASRSTFDSRGLVTMTAFFDVNGAPTNRTAGAYIDNTYDEHDLLASVATRGADGRAMVSHRGFAKVVYSRDDEGHIVSRLHYDAEGNFVQIPGLRTMVISYVGTSGTRPSSITREQADGRAKDAIRRLSRKEPWLPIAKQLSESSSDEPTFGGKDSWYPPVWEAATKLRAGDPPVLIDTERGFMIVERVE